MRWMTLKNEWAAGGKSRRRVASRDRKREWKIARAEDGDWPERNVPHAKVRAGQRLAIRHCCIDANIEPFALAHEICKQLELTDRPRTLALNSFWRQSGLGSRTVY